MKRQLIISTYFMTICLTSCGQTKTETKNQEQQTNIYKDDTSVIAILPFDKTLYRIFKDNKPIDLSNDDLLKIENILNKCVNDYNPEQEIQFNKKNDKHTEYRLDKKNFTIDITRYKRQYVATLNSKGEKEVWVNCFCNTHNKNWKTERIVVKDGGNCYFNLKINLTTGKYYELKVNGNA